MQVQLTRFSWTRFFFIIVMPLILLGLAFGAGFATHYWVMHKKVSQVEVLLYRSNKLLKEHKKWAEVWDQEKTVCFPKPAVAKNN